MPSSTVLDFTDPYEYRKAIHAADLQVIVAARGTFEARLTSIKFDRLWTQHARLSLPAVTYSAVDKSRNIIFFQFVPAQAPILHSGFEVSPNEFMAYAPGSEHHYRTSTSYHCGAMSLSPQDLAKFSEALLGRELRATSVTRAMRPPAALMSRLLRLQKAAGELAATAPDMLENPEVAKALEQELIRAMVACLADPATEERNRSNGRRQSLMRRFEQLLDEKPHDPLYVAEVCAAIGVSERSLRLHCQEQLRMSPHQYLTLRRMNLVWRALALADPAVKTVTGIANDHGFAELGRFAVTYRKLFGESPSVTLRRPPELVRAPDPMGELLILPRRG